MDAGVILRKDTLRSPGGHRFGTRDYRQATVEGRFEYLSKQTEVAVSKENAAPAAGGAASLAGATLSKKPVRKAKLPPKNKSRLPRRQKKAAQKAAARA
jgi:hypothetical protein